VIEIGKFKPPSLSIRNMQLPSIVVEGAGFGSSYLKHGSAAEGGGAFLAFLDVSIWLLLIVFGRRGLKGSLRLDHDG